jgi:hypothetical protein
MTSGQRKSRIELGPRALKKVVTPRSVFSVICMDKEK